MAAPHAIPTTDGVAARNHLPRVFQANLARLFNRIILPVMAGLPCHAALETGEAASLDQFLDRLKAQVDNYTANEAAKAFALTLAGVFERQLSVWARAIEAAGTTHRTRARGFEALLAWCADQAGIDLVAGRLGENLTQMFVVANVVRHGEGQSCNRLQALAPNLWADDSSDYVDVLPGSPIASEQLRIGKNDLQRYIRATTRFWGLADPLPLADTNSQRWIE